MARSRVTARVLTIRELSGAMSGGGAVHAKTRETLRGSINPGHMKLVLLPLHIFVEVDLVVEGDVVGGVVEEIQEVEDLEEVQAEVDMEDQDQEVAAHVPDH